MTQRGASPPVMVSIVDILCGITCDSGSASTSWLQALGDVLSVIGVDFLDVVVRRFM